MVKIFNNNHKDLVQFQIKIILEEFSVEVVQVYFLIIKQHQALDKLKADSDKDLVQLLEGLEHHQHLEGHLLLVGHNKLMEFLKITKIQFNSKVKEVSLDKLIKYLVNLNNTLRHKDLVI